MIYDQSIVETHSFIFSFESVFISLLFSNLVIIFISFVFRNKKVMLRAGYPVILCFLFLSIIRMLIPIELPISHNIALSDGLSAFVQVFIHPYYKGISVWILFCIVWGVVTLKKSIEYFLRIKRIKDNLLISGTDITKDKKYAKYLDQYEFTKKRRDRIHIMKQKDIASPMIFGLRSVYIILPDNNEYSEETLSVIFKHELAHYKNNDLVIKFVMEMLCNIYWWNPFTNVLSKQLNTILEIRIDKSVLDGASDSQIYDYLTCLRDVAVNSSKHTDSVLSLGLSTTQTKLFSSRIAFLDETKNKKSRYLEYALATTIIVLFVISYIFILEPSHMDSEVVEETYGCADPDTSYILSHKDGTYDVYLDGELAYTTDTLDDSFRKLLIVYEED